ncbi:MAG: pseudaminic acid cytidylyltransferase [Boseongicola sp.]
MSICLIPARGGSKRIPRKNIREFNGKPLIAWSIETAFSAGVFSRVIVSTDDDEIADVARDFGAEVPFERPAELSDDHTATIAVVRHSLDWLEGEGTLPEKLCCLYATAPFARPTDIQAGMELLSDAEFAIPVTTYPYPIQRALLVSDETRLNMIEPANYDIRSQDLPEAWHDAGQFYCGRTNAWRSTDRLLGPTAAAIKIPRWRVQDIDTEEDWTRAEIYFRVLSEMLQE